MRFLITLLILTTVAFVLRQKDELVILPASSTTVHTNQQIILEKSSFSPIYMHVFEQDKNGPIEYVNLTEEMRNSKMTIKAFEKKVHNDKTTWMAVLMRNGDKKIYVCELEEALMAKEITLVNK